MRPSKVVPLALFCLSLLNLSSCEFKNDANPQPESARAETLANNSDRLIITWGAGEASAVKVAKQDLLPSEDLGDLKLANGLTVPLDLPDSMRIGFQVANTNSLIHRDLEEKFEVEARYFRNQDDNVIQHELSAVVLNTGEKPEISLNGLKSILMKNGYERFIVHLTLRSSETKKQLKQIHLVFWPHPREGTIKFHSLRSRDQVPRACLEEKRDFSSYPLIIGQKLVNKHELYGLAVIHNTSSETIEYSVGRSITGSIIRPKKLKVSIDSIEVNKRPETECWVWDNLDGDQKLLDARVVLLPTDSDLHHTWPKHLAESAGSIHNFTLKKNESRTFLVYVRTLPQTILDEIQLTFKAFELCKVEYQGLGDPHYYYMNTEDEIYIHNFKAQTRYTHSSRDDDPTEGSYDQNVRLKTVDSTRDGCDD